MLLVAALITGVLFSCTKTEDLIKGTSLNVNTDLLSNPLTIQILSANPGEELPTDITVEVMGPDKDKIYTIFGEKKLVVNTNPADRGTALLPIGVRHVDQLSPVNPIEFSLAIKAEGFMPIMRNYRLTKRDMRMTNVKLHRMSEPVEGIMMKEGSMMVPQEGTANSVHLSTSLNAQGENVGIEMRPGTQVFRKDGKQISGEVKAMVAHYDFQVRGINEIAPASLFSNDAIDRDGNSVGYAIFDPIAMYSVEMEIDGEEVKNFSKPLDVTVRIQPHAVNPETGAYFKAGDSVPVWSYNEDLGEWQEETTATIVAGSGGQLYAYYRQAHLSSWLVGGRRPCYPGTQVNIINSGQDKNGPERFYYVEVYRASDNSLLSVEYNRFFNFENVDIRGESKDIYFKVYSEPTGCSGQILLYTSPVFNSCGEEFTLDLSTELNSDGPFAEIFVQVAGTCSSEYNDLVVTPTLPILYRQSGCDVWMPLGELESGQGATSALKVGEYYDFRISHRTLDRCILNLQVPTQDTTVIIDSPVYNFTETIDITYEPDGKTIILEYTDIQVPDQACEEYIEYLGRIPR